MCHINGCTNFRAAASSSEGLRAGPGQHLIPLHVSGRFGGVGDWVHHNMGYGIFFITGTVAQRLVWRVFWTSYAHTRASERFVSVCASLSHTHTFSHIHTLSHSLTHSLTLSPSLSPLSLRWQCGACSMWPSGEGLSSLPATNWPSHEQACTDCSQVDLPGSETQPENQ